MYHVYSTTANPTRYVKYAQAPQKDINIAEASVLIKGGTGINRKNIATPMGVHTSVSDEDMEWLKDNVTFKDHIAAGCVTVKKQDVNPEVVAADMVTRPWKTDAMGNAIRGDAFPVVPNDFDLDGGKETIKPMETRKKKVA